MTILPNTFAVFWKLPEWDVQFHADHPATTAAEAVQRHRAAFPEDIICSVRGADGRFTSYT